MASHTETTDEVSERSRLANSDRPYYPEKYNEEEDEDMKYIRFERQKVQQTIRVPNQTGMLNPSTTTYKCKNPQKPFYQTHEAPKHGFYDIEPKEYFYRQNHGFLMRTAYKLPFHWRSVYGVGVVIGLTLGAYSMILPKQKGVTHTPEWRAAAHDIAAKSHWAEFGALVELQRSIDEKKRRA